MSDFGFDELNKLAADLSKLPNIVTKEVRKSVQQTAMEVKKSWAKDAAKGVLGRQYAPTIDYELTEEGGLGGQGAISAEIGPDLARYGGKTGKGGLVPSAGIFDDPEASGGIRAVPSRARRRAEKFAAEEFVKRLGIAVDESGKAVGL